MRGMARRLFSLGISGAPLPQKAAEPLEGAEKQVHHEEPYQTDEPGAVKHVGEAEEFEDRVGALRIALQVLFGTGLLRQQGADHATDGDEGEQKDGKRVDEKNLYALSAAEASRGVCPSGCPSFLWRSI